MNIFTNNTFDSIISDYKKLYSRLSEYSQRKVDEADQQKFIASQAEGMATQALADAARADRIVDRLEEFLS